ncbi:MAG: trypsin-like serine protease [Thermoleophilia bacterium]|nr:trypsin-like serine protease [Thermoleophilia bacterium]
MIRLSRAASTFLLVAVAMVIATATATAGTTSSTSAAPVTARIVGGGKPDDATYSSMLRSTVAIISMNAPSQYDGQFCGGTLIDDTHVLTAGHCIVENDPYTYRSAPSSMRVLVGSRTLNDGSLNPSQLIPVQTIFVHPFFNLDTFRYDAAVLRLSRPVTDVPTVSILSDEESAGLGIDSAEVPAIAAGWGDTDTESEDCCFPTDLLALNQTIHTDSTCHSNLDDSPTWRYSAAYEICSGAVGKDTCQGDSGGPLYVSVGGTPRQAGIVSHGVGCGEGFYGIYTKATAIRSFVESIPGIVPGDTRDGTHGPDDSGAPTISSATPINFRQVRLNVSPGAGPAPTKYTLWLRSGPAASAEDVYLGSRTGSSFVVNLPSRRTTAPWRVLVRSLVTNGESPAAQVRTGPKVDQIRPTTPRGLVASRSGSTLTARWGRSIDRQSGIDSYDVQRRSGSRWGKVQHVNGTRLRVRAGSGGEIRVRAVDRAGNVSAWSRPDFY